MLFGVASKSDTGRSRSQTSRRASSRKLRIAVGPIQHSVSLASRPVSQWRIGGPGGVLGAPPQPAPQGIGVGDVPGLGGAGQPPRKAGPEPGFLRLPG